MTRYQINNGRLVPLRLRGTSANTPRTAAPTVFTTAGASDTLQSKHLSQTGQGRAGVPAGEPRQPRDLNPLQRIIEIFIIISAPPAQTIPTISSILLAGQNKCGESAEESGGVRLQRRQTTTRPGGGDIDLASTGGQRGMSVLSVLSSFILLHVQSRQAPQKVAATYFAFAHSISVSTSSTLILTPPTTPIVSRSKVTPAYTVQS